MSLETVLCESTCVYAGSMYLGSLYLSVRLDLMLVSDIQYSPWSKAWGNLWKQNEVQWHCGTGRGHCGTGRVL